MIPVALILKRAEKQGHPYGTGLGLFSTLNKSAGMIAMI